MKRLLRRIRALFTRRRGNDRRPGSGHPVDDVRLHEEAQGKGMEERIETGTFRST